MVQQRIKASTFVENYIKLSRTIPFSFKGREYFIPVYNSDAMTELFMTGRQCAKSTFLAIKQILRSSLIPDLNILYEAPQERQSKKFSRQKIRSILENSPMLKNNFLKLTTTGKIDGINVLEYNCFKTASVITLSTTFGGADRDRGASMNDLYIDELQDQDPLDIQIIAESLSASHRDPYKAYAGTPKTLGNYIQLQWEKSKQIYWHVFCEGCRTWQVPGHPDEISDLHRIIRPEGLLCKKCEKRLNMLKGVWKAHNPNAKMNGWHISQLMRLVKGLKGSIQWRADNGEDGIYDKFVISESPAVFYNEVLGFSYDSAEKPLTMADLDEISLPSLVKADPNKGFDTTNMMPPLTMGIDWGKGNKSYTVVSISMMYQDRPTLIYMVRLKGAQADPIQTAKIIKFLFYKFNCASIYCDYGFWFHFKAQVEEEFGINFVLQHFNFLQYQHDDKHMVKRMMRHKHRHFKLSRVDAMQLFITKIKKKMISIYNFPTFREDGFPKDYLAISYERRESKDKSPMLFFTGSGEQGVTTDAFHSHLYSWVGLEIETGRFKPFIETKEETKEKYTL